MRARLAPRRVRGGRGPARGADLVSMYNRAAGGWDAGLRRLGYHRAYHALFGRLLQAVFPIDMSCTSLLPIIITSNLQWQTYMK